ncbi:MAG: tRNA (adenosine(37)-N6)-dimethylallyltransferase MiaA [Candidatus Lariskella arthropodorum]
MDFSFISDLPRDSMIFVCGATATGKSLIALEIASKLDGVIINADSMQLYKEIPILTAQPTLQHTISQQHRLYGVINCTEKSSVAIWLQLIEDEIKKCLESRKIPIIVGGTGLYIKTLLFGIAKIPNISQEAKSRVNYLVNCNTPQGLHALLSLHDPILAGRIHSNDIQRIVRGLEVFEETGIPLSTWQCKSNKVCRIDANLPHFMIFVNPPRDIIYKRCDERFIQMLKNGAVAEVESVLKCYTNIKYPKALGFEELRSYINGSLSMAEAAEKAQQKTRNYAKRQCTWFNNQFMYDLVITS